MQAHRRTHTRRAQHQLECRCMWVGSLRKRYVSLPDWLALLDWVEWVLMVFDTLYVQVLPSYSISMSQTRSSWTMLRLMCLSKMCSLSAPLVCWRMSGPRIKRRIKTMLVSLVTIWTISLVHYGAKCHYLQRYANAYQSWTQRSRSLSFEFWLYLSLSLSLSLSLAFVSCV